MSGDTDSSKNSTFCSFPKLFKGKLFLHLPRPLTLNTRQSAQSRPGLSDSPALCAGASRCSGIRPGARHLPGLRGLPAFPVPSRFLPQFPSPFPVPNSRFPPLTPGGGGSLALGRGHVTRPRWLPGSAAPRPLRERKKILRLLTKNSSLTRPSWGTRRRRKRRKRGGLLRSCLWPGKPRKTWRWAMAAPWSPHPWWDWCPSPAAVTARQRQVRLRFFSKLSFVVRKWVRSRKCCWVVSVVHGCYFEFLFFFFFKMLQFCIEVKLNKRHRCRT